MKNDLGQFLKETIMGMNQIYFEGLKQGIEISEKENTIKNQGEKKNEKV